MDDQTDGPRSPQPDPGAASKTDADGPAISPEPVGRRSRPSAFDLALAAVLAALAVADHLIDPRQVAWLPIEPWWVVGPLLLVMYLPLAWRRVMPMPTMAMTGTATGVLALLGLSLGAAMSGVIVALYSVAAYGSREEGRVSLAISGVFIAGSALSAWAQGAPFGPVDFALNTLAFVGVWALGDRARARRLVLAQLTARADEAERSRQLAAELAVADERSRIARELHDVVAHAVSVVVVQAGAGQRVAERDPSQAVQALASIESTGRDALRDLRDLVGLLRDPPADLTDDPHGSVGADGRHRSAPATGDRSPQPTVADVANLVERLIVAGVPVRLERRGDLASLPTGVAVSSYRIVQEALTNVLKHAGPVEDVVVTLDRRADRLLVSVEDDGQVPPDDGKRTAVGGGAGLAGMRERVAVFGGLLRAGPRPGGGFVVRARLPVAADDAPGGTGAGIGRGTPS